MKRFLILPILALSLIAGTTTAVAADAPTTPEPPPAPVLPTPPTMENGSWTARVLFPASARAKPGAGKVVMKLKHYATYTQGPNVFMVTDATMVGDTMWVRVQLPKRPNGSQGWISEDALELRQIRTWVRVSVSTRKVLVFKNGKRIKSFGAAVGTGGTPDTDRPVCGQRRCARPRACSLPTSSC